MGAFFSPDFCHQSSSGGEKKSPLKFRAGIFSLSNELD
jgi:hypothetical protein